MIKLKTKEAACVGEAMEKCIADGNVNGAAARENSSAI
jgi:hypothetical protein